MTIDQLETILFERLVLDAPQIKVARLVVDCTRDTEIFDESIRQRLFWDDAVPQGANDHIVDEALLKLSHRDDIEVLGNPLKWRFSEIRRKEKAG